MTLRFLGLALFATLGPLCTPYQAQIPLPTPKDHYRNFDASQLGVDLVTGLLTELDPRAQKLLLQMMDSPATELSKIPRSEALAALRSVNWEKWKPQILEVFLHQSNALAVIPQGSREWTPVVHDALLYFLGHLDRERLFSRLLDFAYLPQDSPRGDRILQFASRTPTFQKIGQILARNTSLEPDIQKALQTLENSVQTSTRDELVAFIEAELGLQTLEKYQIQFDSSVLAEASVGAVIRASLQLPEESRRREVVCKVIKPYVAEAILEETALLDQLTRYFSRSLDFYELGAMPLTEMFQEIKKSMSDEIDIAREQRNLLHAASYYKDNPRILIPELYPFSTKRVTVMQFVQGEKISNAFPDNAREKAVMARRLSDTLTYEAIFSKREESLFHGDPHAGNVFHVLNDPRDPHRIALLDWGLCGFFSRNQRRDLVQLILAIDLKDARRLKRHLGALIDGEVPQSAEKSSRLDQLLQEVLYQRSKRSNFETLSDLIMRLSKEGYLLHFNITLFIKSQVTIAGILAGLDPKLRQDDYLMKRAGSLVWKELPKHFLYTIWFPAWNSHSYRSMLSNEDIKDVVVHRIGRWFKK